MQTFRDSAGRTWTLNLTIGAVRRVKAALSLDLCQLHAGDPPLLLRLEQDCGQLFEVVYELVADQAKALGVSAEQFAESIDAGSIGAAAEAFWAELVGFFRAWRPAVAQMIAETRQPPIPGSASGDSPASPESTPAVSASAS